MASLPKPQWEIELGGGNGSNHGKASLAFNLLFLSKTAHNAKVHLYSHFSS